jgi:hypothetical protein
MVVRVVHITQTDRGLRLGEGIDGFEEAMSRYAIEAIRAGILGVHASRPIERGSVVDAPVARVSRTGNARIVRDARGKKRVITTRAVDRGEEITVIGSSGDHDEESDDETYERARRDVRRGIEYTRRAESERTERTERTERSERSERPERSERNHGSNRTGRTERTENDKNDKNDKGKYYQSMLGERYIHRALRLLQKKPVRV